MERPRITRIARVTRETPRHATIAFADGPLADSAAGTFCMVWVPGVDEVPMGTGFTAEDGLVTLTVEAKGDCTRALLDLPEGALIGVRGPYGTGFTLDEGPIWFVGGGTGIAPMARGAQQARAAGLDVEVFSGARNAEVLLLHEHLQGRAAAGDMQYHPATDDGSHGFPGTNVAAMQQRLDAGAAPAAILACGPEPMMVAAVHVAREAGIPCEVSLERYMKCATGICDACTIGDGLRLCREGPVLPGEVAETAPEFGVAHRDAAGILHPW